MRRFKGARFFAPFVLAMAVVGPITVPTTSVAAKDAATSYVCTLDRISHEGLAPAGSARSNATEYTPGGLCATLTTF